MPPHQAHLARAQENLALYVAQKAVLPPHWQAVILFYAAVHSVEAMCDALGHGGSVTHVERDAYIQDRHPNLWRAYSRLKRESVKARYLTTAHGPQWERGAFSLSAAQVEDQLYARAMKDVIGYVEAAAPVLKRTLTMGSPESAKTPPFSAG